MNEQRSQYTAVIVDDETLPREVLKMKINEYCPEIRIIGEATNAQEAYETILKMRPQIVFLDIAMPGETGIEMLQRFEHIDFQIIFVTGYDEYSLQALRMSAVDYLLKPILNEDLVRAVKKAIKRIKNQERMMQYEILLHNLKAQPAQFHDRKIAIPTAKTIEIIDLHNIIYIEGWQRYTRIHIQGQDPVLSSYNLGIWKDLLKNHGFLTIHRSYLVNIAMIRRYHREGYVELIDGTQLPVSRACKNQLVERLLNRKSS